jgi:hypothetical protein
MKEVQQLIAGSSNRIEPGVLEGHLKLATDDSIVAPG